MDDMSVTLVSLQPDVAAASGQLSGAASCTPASL